MIPVYKMTENKFLVERMPLEKISEGKMFVGNIYMDKIFIKMTVDKLPIDLMTRCRPEGQHKGIIIDSRT
jgi:hypothetical protein